MPSFLAAAVRFQWVVSSARRISCFSISYR